MLKLVYSLFCSENAKNQFKVPKTNQAALLSQKIIVDAQPNESQITLWHRNAKTLLVQGSYHVPAIVAMLEKIYRSDTMSLLYIW
jgi:hypothetical protein